MAVITVAVVVVMVRVFGGTDISHLVDATTLVATFVGTVTRHLLKLGQLFAVAVRHSNVPQPIGRYGNRLENPCSHTGARHQQS
jgi:hypothetical protein